MMAMAMVSTTRALRRRLQATEEAHRMSIILLRNVLGNGSRTLLVLVLGLSVLWVWLVLDMLCDVVLELFDKDHLIWRASCVVLLTWDHVWGLLLWSMLLCLVLGLLMTGMLLVLVLLVLVLWMMHLHLLVLWPNLARPSSSTFNRWLSIRSNLHHSSRHSQGSLSLLNKAVLSALLPFLSVSLLACNDRTVCTDSKTHTTLIVPLRLCRRLQCASF